MADSQAQRASGARSGRAIVSTSCTWLGAAAEAAKAAAAVAGAAGMATGTGGECEGAGKARALWARTDLEAGWAER